jgi:parallel beta-helix repeat protein
MTHKRFVLTVFALGCMVGCADPSMASCVNPGGTGGCLASIQAAVDTAGAGEVIEIEAGAYVENVVIGPGSRLTLRGAGAGATVVDGGAAGSVIAVSGPRTRVSIEDLTVQNGSASGIVGERARIRVFQCDVTGNSMGFPGGGGIRDVGERRARFEIVESSIRGNTATGAGGGVALVRPSSARVVRSTVSGNTASNNGGGITVASTRLVLEASTVSGNGATFGGGVHGSGLSRSRILIRNSTIAGNSASNQGGGIDMVGGRVRLDSTILAGNTAPAGPECSVPFEPLMSRGYNLIEDPSGCDVVGRTDLDLSGVDPLLGPLQDNGGPTETRALLAGSPALDAVASPRFCRDPDQRGEARTVPCDIGAYEAP